MRKVTFCLDFGKANPNTYQNWTTVRFNDDNSLDRLTNAEGNGQRWERIGSWSGNDYAIMLDTPDASDSNLTHALKVVNTVCDKRCIRSLGWRGLYGFCVNATAVDVTGQKVTAAPSLMGNARDKNRNRAREAANGTNMAQRMAEIVAAREKAKATK